MAPSGGTVTDPEAAAAESCLEAAGITVKVDPQPSASQRARSELTLKDGSSAIIFFYRTADDTAKGKTG